MYIKIYTHIISVFLFSWPVGGFSVVPFCFIFWGMGPKIVQKLGSIQKNTYEIPTILGAEFEQASSIGSHILRMSLFVYIHAEVMQHHMVILALTHKINQEIDKLTFQQLPLPPPRWQGPSSASDSWTLPRIQGKTKMFSESFPFEPQQTCSNWTLKKLNLNWNVNWQSHAFTLYLFPWLMDFFLRHFFGHPSNSKMSKNRTDAPNFPRNSLINSGTCSTSWVFFFVKTWDGSSTRTLQGSPLMPSRMYPHTMGILIQDIHVKTCTVTPPKTLHPYSNNSTKISSSHNNSCPCTTNARFFFAVTPLPSMFPPVNLPFLLCPDLVRDVGTDEEERDFLLFVGTFHLPEPLDTTLIAFMPRGFVGFVQPMGGSCSSLLDLLGVENFFLQT